MFRKLQLIAVLFAWLLATGAQWDFLQVYAWSRMLATNARSMQLSKAVEKTFDGEMCEVCRAVNKAKRAEETPGVPGEKRISKLILLFQPKPVFVFSGPGSPRWSLSDSEAIDMLRSAPPVPPPRGVFV